MDVPKLLFRASLVAFVVVVPYVAGVYSALHENSGYRAVKRADESIRESIAGIEETSFFVPEHFLQWSRQPGDGVTINLRPDDGALILLSGFFDGGNELRLIRRDGSVVRRWPVKFSELFPAPDHLRHPPATDWNIDLHGALVLPDGSPVFNFEYGGLVKLDRCGNVAWTLAHETHHSVERAEGGGFWVPGRRRLNKGPSAFPPFPVPYKEDLLLKVSEAGAIEQEISLPEILYENGLAPLMTATGEDFTRGKSSRRELVHLNKIAELQSGDAASFPAFQAGDLLLSLRNHNMLLVVDPHARKVRWWQIGPWIRQHDPEFSADGTITIFNNNTYAQGMLDEERSDPKAPRLTNILRFDPRTGASTVVFGERPGQEMLSVLRGKHDLTAEGGVLVTEFEAGRVLEADATGRIVWEYVNRYDADNVAEITEARLYPRDYFSVSDWSCADGTKD
jgi:hypothetical protein